MPTNLNIFLYHTINSSSKDGTDNLPGLVMIAVHIMLSLVNWLNRPGLCHDVRKVKDVC